MAIPIIGDILGEVFGKVGDVVSEVVVDKDKRNEIKANLERLKLEAIDKSEQRLHEQMLGQMEINKVEAGSSSLFVAGWRPAAGWASVGGLVYATLLEPLCSWAARVLFDYTGPFPEIDPTLLIFVLGGMLGIGAMRSYEKVKGVSSDVLEDLPAASRNVPRVVSSQPPLPEEAPWQK